MDLEAVHDVWFVGDQFLNECINTLTALKMEAKLSKNAAPLYIHDYYNVHSFIQLKETGVSSLLARIYNAIIKALNTRSRLPRFLVIILDQDLITDVAIYDFKATKQIKKALNWLMRQIDMIVRRKQLEIYDRKPGALTNTDPALIFVKMIRKGRFFPQGSRLKNICMLRPKFNAVLAELVAARNCYIMSIESCSTEECFDTFGKLTKKGKTRFWHEIDELLEKFDKGKISLRPRTYKKQRKSQMQGIVNNTSKQPRGAKEIYEYEEYEEYSTSKHTQDNTHSQEHEDQYDSEDYFAQDEALEEEFPYY